MRTPSKGIGDEVSGCLKEKFSFRASYRVPKGYYGYYHECLSSNVLSYEGFFWSTSRLEDTLTIVVIRYTNKPLCQKFRKLVVAPKIF